MTAPIALAASPGSNQSLKAYLGQTVTVLNAHTAQLVTGTCIAFPSPSGGTYYGIINPDGTGTLIDNFGQIINTQGQNILAGDALALAPPSDSGSASPVGAINDGGLTAPVTKAPAPAASATAVLTAPQAATVAAVVAAAVTQAVTPSPAVVAAAIAAHPAMAAQTSRVAALEAKVEAIGKSIEAKAQVVEQDIWTLLRKVPAHIWVIIAGGSVVLGILVLIARKVL